MNGSISYLKEGIAVEFKNKLYVAEGVHIKFEKVAVGAARLFFANFAGLAVPVPDGVVVLKDSNQPVDPIGESFLLSWEHNYAINVNGERFYNLRKQKQHNVSAPVCRTAKTLLVAQTAAEAEFHAQEARAFIDVQEGIVEAVEGDDDNADD
ncbi:hypothetical protein Vretimale_12158 [Volvox reticuliferus]|uniref:Uncharacterized protein n=1 Tax=Volvox reticuliferus TaxID=1737510 RepID=A0A8J4LRM5_9CHLO|nr:hypothetical protein Vretimale_12158 [Volvox reticuliferus]